MKRVLRLPSLLAGATLAVAGCATDDSFRLPGLDGPPSRGGGGATPFVWYYGPGDVPRLHAGPVPFYDPYFYYRYGGLPPRYGGPFPFGYGPGYGPGFGMAYGPGYGYGYPFGPYWPYATAPCRDADRNGRCDPYAQRPPKPPKPPRPPRSGSPGDIVPPGMQPGDGRSNLPPIVAPPPPRAAPPRPADRGDEREPPRRRFPQVEPERDR